MNWSPEEASKKCVFRTFVLGDVEQQQSHQYVAELLVYEN